MTCPSTFLTDKSGNKPSISGVPPSTNTLCFYFKWQRDADSSRINWDEINVSNITDNTKT